MDNRKPRTINRKHKKRTKSFTEALKEKYCVEDEPTFDFIIVSPKRKSNSTEAELGHLRTVVLNEMDVSRAEIPRAGLTSLCPNVIDLDLANNLLESWPELLAILSDLPRVKYVNVSGNKLRLPLTERLPSTTRLSVENLALNFTGSTLEEVVRLSQLMPGLKELHLCGNDYKDLSDIDECIKGGAFSALECLRLNNNGITSWCEIWKLRHLPQLKYLIISGNPVKDIFYCASYALSSAESRKENKLSKDETMCEVNVMDTREDAVDSGDIVVEVAGNGSDGERDDVILVDDVKTATSGCDVVEADTEDGGSDADYFVERSISDGDEEGDDEIDCEISDVINNADDDDNEDEDNGNAGTDNEAWFIPNRPVSRVGHYDDSGSGVSPYGSMANLLGAVEAKNLPKSAVSSANLHPASDSITIPMNTNKGRDKKTKVHNTNFNNSRSGNANHKLAYDDSSSSGSTNNLLAGVDDLDASFPELLAAMAGGPGEDFDLDPAGEDDPGDWPRIAAEQFLYDLIDQLDLGESGPATSASSSVSSATAYSPSSLYTSSYASLLSSSTSSSTPSVTSTTAAVADYTALSFQSSSNLYQRLHVPAVSHRLDSLPHSDRTGTLSAVDSCNPPSTSVSNHSSNPTTISSKENASEDEKTNNCNNNSSGTNASQTALSGNDYLSKVLAAIADDDFAGSDTEENTTFAQIYSEDDFIPRSVTMLDGEEGAYSNSYFSPPPFLCPTVNKLAMTSLTNNLNVSQSSAKRRLFGSEESGQISCPVPPLSDQPGNRDQSKHLDSNRAASVLVSQSESDSCSDCEFEQHSLTAALRRELADSNSEAPTPITDSAKNASVRSVTGPGSWLEMNPSFSTSVRDTRDGFSISMTTAPGVGRIVTTGLSSDDNCCLNTQESSNKDINSTKESASCRAADGDTSVEKCSTYSHNCRSMADQNVEAAFHELQPQAGQMNNPPQVPEMSSAEDPSLNSDTLSVPFHQLQMLCMSSAALSHADHLHACTLFPKLNNVRLKNNPLYSSVNNDDKRKLYIASLPNVTILNGSEVTGTEREKAERFFLRYFMDRTDKPDLYHRLVAKHGPPVKLVDIDLSAGFQEWATLTFRCEGATAHLPERLRDRAAASFTRKLHLVEPVGRLRSLVAQVLGLPKWCFLLHHHPCGPSHPESEREVVELRCEALPMSRFDFAEGDEIIVDIKG